MTPEGLIIIASDYGPKETAERLVRALTARGIALLARIDHAAAATKASMTLRPTEVFIFGNPKVGTPLMLAAQTAGIDLPLKVLIWQDEDDKTWLAYNEPKWIAARHGLSDGALPVLGAMATVLDAVARDATASQS